MNAVAKLKIQYRKVDDLVPYARNAKVHGEKQVKQLAAAIEQFGFLVPVLVDGKAGIIAGHGRVLAAKSLELKEVPTIEVAHLTAEQKRAFILADNRLAESSEWDREKLAFELSFLNERGFNLSLTGFKESEISNYLAERAPAAEGENVTPEVEAVPVSVPGDVWQLGPHRLVCGDSTDPAVVELALAGGDAFLMVTDPPYGVKYDPAWRSAPAAAKALKHPRKGSVGRVKNDDVVDWAGALGLFKGDVAYVFQGDEQIVPCGRALDDMKFERRCLIVWNKPVMVVGRGNYHHKHESAWYAVRKGKPARWRGGRKQSTVWDIDSPRANGNADDGKTEHSTQKPVEAMRRPILNHTVKGDRVYDPFLGSGTTLMAAETTGRICIGIEIEPRYCDLIVRRWQAFTKKQALHAQTKEKFDDRTKP